MKKFLLYAVILSVGHSIALAGEEISMIEDPAVLESTFAGKVAVGFGDYVFRDEHQHNGDLTGKDYQGLTYHNSEWYIDKRRSQICYRGNNFGGTYCYKIGKDADGVYHYFEGRREIATANLTPIEAVAAD